MVTFKVFKLSVAHQLTKMGFNIIEVVPNKDKPWLNVYGFENTQELREAVKLVTASTQN